MFTKEAWNGARFQSGARAGHYESWFQRANHPTRPLAFWIRYTIFNPKGAPEDAQGELWGMWFDGEKKDVRAFYQALPIAECSFAADRMQAKIGASELTAAALRGRIEDAGKTMSWDLAYEGEAPPLLLYPEDYYFRALPKAKVLTANPLVRYDGVLRMADGEQRIERWLGCQSHNWGTKHTDLYAWTQVAGFDGAPDAYLECAVAKLKIGGVWLPKLAPLVLRLDGEDHLLSTPGALWKNRGSYGDWRMEIDAFGKGIHVNVVTTAKTEAFAALPYRNPPGGVKRCLNSKIARCELTVQKDGQPAKKLVASHNAAFEIVGDVERLERLGFRLA